MPVAHSRRAGRWPLAPGSAPTCPGLGRTALFGVHQPQHQHRVDLVRRLLQRRFQRCCGLRQLAEFRLHHPQSIVVVRIGRICRHRACEDGFCSGEVVGIQGSLGLFTQHRPAFRPTLIAQPDTTEQQQSHYSDRQPTSLLRGTVAHHAHGLGADQRPFDLVMWRHEPAQTKPRQQPAQVCDIVDARHGEAEHQVDADHHRQVAQALAAEPAEQRAIPQEEGRLGADQPEDRARRAERGHVRSQEVVRHVAGQARQKIDRREPTRAEQALHVAAHAEERPTVEGEMHQPGVQEDGAQQTPVVPADDQRV